jgi:hypothetical protein
MLNLRPGDQQRPTAAEHGAERPFTSRQAGPAATGGLPVNSLTVRSETCSKTESSRLRLRNRRADGPRCAGAPRSTITAACTVPGRGMARLGGHLVLVTRQAIPRGSTTCAPGVMTALWAGGELGVSGRCHVPEDARRRRVEVEHFGSEVLEPRFGKLACQLVGGRRRSGTWWHRDSGAGTPARCARRAATAGRVRVAGRLGQATCRLC